MLFRSMPFVLVAVAVFATASLILSGCGGGGGGPAPAAGEIVSVSVFPNEIPAAGGPVTATAVTTGNVEAPSVSIAPEGGTGGVAVTMSLVGPMDPNGTTWVASPIVPSTTVDVYLVATVTGRDTNGRNLEPKSSPQFLQYGTGSSKPNITLWGQATAVKTGSSVAIQGITLQKQESTGWVNVSIPRAYKDSTGRFQIPFVGTPGVNYMLTLNAGSSYYAYQKIIVPVAGVNPKINAQFTSTDDPPPPPPF